jgi:dTDP-4-dehydrorhamnose reductase
MRLLVTGAAGQLGAVVARSFRAAGHDVVGVTRADLDVTDHAAVADTVGRVRPGAILNCAAFNDVDGAEDRPEAAFAANAFAVRSLARAAAVAGAVLVHYSSDFVFDGRASAPYTEDDAPNPQSVYAASKLAGEWFARDAPRHYVLRVESLFGGPAARSSVDRIVEGLEAGRAVPVFVDRVTSPSYVEDVAMATARLLERRAPAGVYHCVNSGHATWSEIAREVARAGHLDASHAVPVAMADVPLKARRPRFAALDNGKLASCGVPMPAWQDAVARHLQRRQDR